MLTISRATSIVEQVYLSGLRAEWDVAHETIRLTGAECDDDQQGVTLGMGAVQEIQPDYDAARAVGLCDSSALLYAVRHFAHGMGTF